MKGFFPVLICALALAACSSGSDGALPGYIEADLVRIASPYAGRLIRLEVARGAEVRAGGPLFVLDYDSEAAERDAAAARLEQARAQAADLAKGRRADEIAVIQSQVEAARAVLRLAESDLVRQQQLAAANFISAAGLDSLIEKVNNGRARLAETEAQLRVAHLAARRDERAAAEAASEAAKAVLAQSDWKLAQRTMTAPVAARVDDTLYRIGEWVPAGAPVVSLLPPGNVKVRFYVPQVRLPEMRLGDIVKVYCDGCGAARDARIGFIAAQAEFTPPVIYSKENRAKLVFLVEAWPLDPRDLRPGQPVDVVPGALR